MSHRPEHVHATAPLRRRARTLAGAAAALLLAGLPAASAAKTFEVTKTADDGAGTLRKAIERANARSGEDRINFDLPARRGKRPPAIVLASALPQITDQVRIDGYSQRGARPSRRDDGTNARIQVQLRGEGTVEQAFSLQTRKSVIAGFAISDFAGDGIVIGGETAEPVTGNRVMGNFIGTDRAGRKDDGNDGAGVRITGGATGNRIGGGKRARNLISGNGEAGVLIAGSGTDGNSIRGNLIGTDRRGKELPVDEGLPQDTGVVIQLGARFNSIGALERAKDGGANTIAFNDDDGVLIGGTQLGAADPTDANPIRFNSIHSNGGEDAIGLGINLDSGLQGTPDPFEGLEGRQPFGVDVTANDDLDPDTGPNNEQNHPEITTATDGGKRAVLAGELRSEPDATYVLDFYANFTEQAESENGDACDPSGRGEGESYLGSVEIQTDGSGVATFSDRVEKLDEGTIVTATATKLAGGDEAMQPPPATSEFSPCAEVAAG